MFMFNISITMAQIVQTACVSFFELLLVPECIVGGEAVAVLILMHAKPNTERVDGVDLGRFGGLH